MVRSLTGTPRVFVRQTGVGGYIRRLLVGTTVVAIATVHPLNAGADTAPRWSDRELVGFAEVVVTGEVIGMTSRWDEAVEGIYTYVTVRVEEVLKGSTNRRRITLKQLGGRARGRTLHVAGQATFRVGERVVLFLEVRPRDRTLYTYAHWQGKWRVERDASSGEERAVREVPEITAQRSAAPADDRSLEGLLRDVRSLVAEDRQRATASRIRFIPPELNNAGLTAVDGEPYSLFFVRWHEADDGAAITVDVDAAGQPGLAGGGGGEIGVARGQWNGVGTSLVLGAGGGVAAARDCG